MDFKDQIKQLGERVAKLKEATRTEEATKTAFILPMLHSLGYDVFNPTEVVPEYITDVGIKKGEKIDYAIFQDDAPIILIECKHWRENLDVHDGQLLRYFHVSKARFAILTNGLTYKFYTDLEEPNKMDEKPFFEFNVTELKDAQIDELKKFHKSYFDVNSIINTAGELKYTNALKALIHTELNEPSEGLVRFFSKQVYSGTFTQRIVEQFTGLLKKSINQYISDLITDRLKSALTREAQQQANPVESNNLISESQITPEAEPQKIETTLEEMEGFYIVKSILRSSIDAQRIHYKDAQSYFSVILDDSSRKTICRLYLNGRKKYIGIVNAQRAETKHELNTIDDVFAHSEALLEVVKQFALVK